MNISALANVLCREMAQNSSINKPPAGFSLHIKSKKKAISERYNTKTALIGLLQTHFRDQFVTCPSSKILGHGMSKIGGSLS